MRTAAAYPMSGMSGVPAARLHAGRRGRRAEENAAWKTPGNGEWLRRAASVVELAARFVRSRIIPACWRSRPSLVE